MMPTPITEMAPLDRRVEVLSGPGDLRETARYVSDLRAYPFVVILGEPGIGKSTVLGTEAVNEGAPLIKVRALINGFAPQAGTPLYLDALDEYRTDGHAADKAYLLAGAMIRAQAPRWRLTCRSEDWRKEADIEAISGTVGGTPIVVAQILPLNYKEARAILTALGETDPESFLDKAWDFGAKGFTESPLSLRLLHAAVSRDGTWPTTRFELFTVAIERLSFERDRQRSRAERHPPEAIVSAAAEACLTMLLTGARTLWRSNDEPPPDADARAYLTSHDLGQVPGLLRDTLDTALFRGEGEAFEPMHLTLADFLAGKALARAVHGGPGRAALPFARAFALITGEDGGPPTELRGVFAWFASHLAQSGDGASAMRLIEADAATVLAYGDAAAFNKDGRRAILTNLTRHDPYFRMSEIGVTAVGGLSGNDLVEDFREILTDQLDVTHRTITVLDALTAGAPVESLRATLRDIALDPKRPEWLRERAIEALLNGESKPTVVQSSLLNSIAAEPSSIAREALRVKLAAALPRHMLPLEKLKEIIADYECCDDDNMVGRLHRLKLRLEDEPRGELFDVPVASWRSKEPERFRQTEVDSLLEHALSAAIRSTEDLDGERLWRWAAGFKKYTFDRYSDEIQKATQEWISQSTTRELAIFDTCMAYAELNAPGKELSYQFSSLVGRKPSPSVIRAMFIRAKSASNDPVSRQLLSIAVELARDLDMADDVYWELWDVLSARSDFADLNKILSYTTIPDWRLRERVRIKQKRLDEINTRAKNLEILNPLIADLRVGRYPSHLDWAAELYWSRERDGLSGIDRLLHLTSLELVDAFVEGWKYTALNGLGGITAAELGASSAENTAYRVERPALTGLSLQRRKCGTDVQRSTDTCCNRSSEIRLDNQGWQPARSFGALGIQATCIGC